MKKTTHPSGAEAHRLVDLSGTAEAVPFPKAMQEVTSKNIKLKVTTSGEIQKAWLAEAD